MGYILFGEKMSSADTRVVSNTETAKPGAVYEQVLTVDRNILLSEYSQVSEAISKVRAQFPDVNIMAVEIDGNKITMQLYDPAQYIVGLIIVAAIIALAILLLVITPGVLKELLNIAESSPLGFALVAAAVALAFIAVSGLVKQKGSGG